MRLRCKTVAHSCWIEELRGFPSYFATRWNDRKPTYRHTLQRPRYYLSELTAKLVLGAAGFPWTAKIEETYPVIKEEMLAARGRARKHQQNLVDQGSWSVL